jgi:hypothetical protein
VNMQQRAEVKKQERLDCSLPEMLFVAYDET